VLEPGGKWLLWDASMPAAPAAEKREFTICLRPRQPKETIEYGYSVVLADHALDLDYYRGWRRKQASGLQARPWWDRIGRHSRWSCGRRSSRLPFPRATRPKCIINADRETGPKPPTTRIPDRCLH
jgi:hypothetical protein